MNDRRPRADRRLDRPALVIVTPALADANNGNSHHALRWQQLLADRYRVRLVREWAPGGPGPAPVAMMALHARRSAASIAAWAQAHPGRGLAVVLTGTDLYRDIHTDAAAQRSLALAQRLVVLQERGPAALPAALRPRTRVIYPSTSARQALPKTSRHLRAVMVGHLRPEKDPETLFAAVRQLRPEDGIRIDHLGGALDPALGAQAQALMAACPHYRWLGARPHEETRRRIQRAHLLVHPSVMEGGAHVVMEALRSGTPVLASRIDGNVGQLGADYAGYFEPHDARALAALLTRCRDGLRAPSAGVGAGVDPGALWTTLQAQCACRSALFDPTHEQAALHGLCDELLAG